MAANDSYPKPAGADEFKVAKFKPGYKAFVDPDKLPNQPGEYYAKDIAPVLNFEWNESEYWKTAERAKTPEQVAEELDAPRKALEEKWASYCEGAVEDSRVPLTPMWTPAMQMMTSELPQARKLNFELAPFFQLNEKGYRKNWANTAIAEYKPFQ